MCQWHPVGPIRLVQELQPQVRPDLERTLDQPRLERSRAELLLGGSLAEAELSNRERHDLDEMLSAERCEPAILEQHLRRVVELDILLAQCAEQLRFAHAPDAHCLRCENPMAVCVIHHDGPGCRPNDQDQTAGTGKRLDW